MKNVLNILKICFWVLLVSFFSSLTSCNTCDSGDGGSGNDPNNVLYFTAFPLNSLVPSIYSAESSGRLIANLSANGSLFSAPAGKTNIKRIAYLRYDNNLQKNLIIIKNIDGSDSAVVDRDNNQYGVAFPVLSPDANKIAFYGGNGKLYLWVRDPFNGSSYIEKLTGQNYPGTLPAFSPDSKMLAFYEGDPSSGSFSLKIIDSEMPDVVINQVDYSNSSLIAKNENAPEWSFDSRKICFPVKSDDIEKLIIYSLNSSSEEIKFGNLGVRYAVLSPDAKHLMFASKDGSLWLRTLDSDPKYKQLIDSEGLFSISNASWSPSGNKILFSKYYPEDGNFTFSTIFTAELVNDGNSTNLKNIKLISNNAYKAYWGR